MPNNNISLIEKILYSVEKPGRYVGGEHNQIVKDWEAVDVRWCLVFPDVYDIGQANLGLAILYQILNAEETILAERSFAPWVDMEVEMRRHQILPLCQDFATIATGTFQVAPGQGRETAVEQVLQRLRRVHAAPVLAGGSCR